MSEVAPEVSGSQIEEAVRKLAEENPDFVYIDQEERGDAQGDQYAVGCSYLGAMAIEGKDSPYSGEGHSGQACIVGQALAKCGFTRDQLQSVEGLSARDALQRLGIKDLTTEHTNWLTTVQMQQDRGIPWKLAVSWSDEYNSEEGQG